MAELTLSEYAERKGISIHTARRKMTRGDVPGRLEGSRYIVTVPDEEPAAARPYGQAEAGGDGLTALDVGEEAGGLFVAAGVGEEGEEAPRQRRAGRTGRRRGSTSYRR